jgi:hypothetical protein
LPSGTDYQTWLASRVAASEAPDIAWDQYGNRNRVQGDWWVPLDEFLEMPNPYIEAGTLGSERWVDSFPDYVMNQTRAPSFCLTGVTRWRGGCLGIDVIDFAGL